MATEKKPPAKKAVSVTKVAPAPKASAKKAASAKAAAPAKKVTAKAAAPAKKAASEKKAPAAKRSVNAAFMKALTPSGELAAVVGAKALPRTEVVKKLWDYIKKNELQDAVNKRLVNADAKLKEVFGKAQVTMFEIAGLIGKHLK
ncbi:MAG TPA: SWIB/MDM2 domain-containing protein [Rhodoferax sp.]|nr:SWIB/MDM2 domain-containing protein [Rhodoferax sp.]